MNESAVLEFWRDYLDGPPPDLDQEPKLSGVFSFGDSKKLADELAALVRQGIKTATCSELMGCEKASGSLIILARPLVLQSSRAADREMQTMTQVSDQYRLESGQVCSPQGHFVLPLDHLHFPAFQ